jgi:peptide/nickel transport system substrate-binding protein
MSFLNLTRRSVLALTAATALALGGLSAADAQTPPGVLVVGQIAEPQALDPACRDRGQRLPHPDERL